jgi:hypothetical protein
MHRRVVEARASRHGGTVVGRCATTHKCLTRLTSNCYLSAARTGPGPSAYASALSNSSNGSAASVSRGHPGDGVGDGAEHGRGTDMDDTVGSMVEDSAHERTAVSGATSTSSPSGTPHRRTGPKRRLRLDEYCLQLHPQYSRNAIQSWILQGKVFPRSTARQQQQSTESLKPAWVRAATSAAGRVAHTRRPFLHPPPTPAPNHPLITCRPLPVWNSSVMCQ